MSSPFTRSLRSLEADRFRPQALWLAMGTALLVAWTVWFFGSEIPLYESSNRGRIEAVRAVHSVDAPVAGRVARSYLELGRHVGRGEVLVELEAEDVRLSLAERLAEKTAAEIEIERLREELAAERKALEAAARQGRAAIAEARARRDEALPKLELEERRSDALSRMPEGLLSEMDRLERTTEAEEARRAARTLEVTIERLESSMELEVQNQRLRVERLKGRAARLEGDLEVLDATLDRLRYELDRRRIRAPRPGRLAQVRDLQSGAHVEAGERLAAVVAEGDLRVVASFEPDVAVGVIRPGQRAQLRLAAFPWTRYGTVPATVRDIGTETSSDHVRVELTIDAPDRTGIPLQHGLSTSVDVEVARVSPAELLLRSIGARLQNRGTDDSLSIAPRDELLATRAPAGDR